MVAEVVSVIRLNKTTLNNINDYNNIMVYLGNLTNDCFIIWFKDDPLSFINLDLLFKNEINWVGSFYFGKLWRDLRRYD